MRITAAAGIITFIAAVAGAQERSMFRADLVEHLVALSSPAFEAKPDISDDKLTLYFASAATGTVGDLDLWVTTRPVVGATWGPKSNITALNSTERDHTPTTSADGLLMIFSSNRIGGPGSDDSWMATRPSTTAPWNTPTLIPGLSSPQRDMGYTMTPDGLNLYFTSNRPGVGGFDLYMTTRATRTAPWGPPVPIPELNTPWDDKFPSVTGDNLTMYFASNRPGSVPTTSGLPSLDLWVAMRPTASSPWTVVENVHELNTQNSEYLMSVANDDSELYFVSDRPGALGLFDLYSTVAMRSVTRYGKGTFGFAGVPRITPQGGDPVIGNAGWGYAVTNVSPFAFGFLITATGSAPGPFLVDFGQLLLVNTFQLPSLTNPPAQFPRILSFPLPNDPTLVGVTTWCQVIMAYDLVGQAQFGGIPFSASPGMRRTFIQ